MLRRARHQRPNQVIERGAQGCRELSDTVTEFIGERRLVSDLHPHDIESQFRIVLSDRLIVVLCNERTQFGVERCKVVARPVTLTPWAFEPVHEVDLECWESTSPDD